MFMFNIAVNSWSSWKYFACLRFLHGLSSRNIECLVKSVEQCHGFWLLVEDDRCNSKWRFDQREPERVLSVRLSWKFLNGWEQWTLWRCSERRCSKCWESAEDCNFGEISSRSTTAKVQFNNRKPWTQASFPACGCSMICCLKVISRDLHTCWIYLQCWRIDWSNLTGQSGGVSWKNRLRRPGRELLNQHVCWERWNMISLVTWRESTVDSCITWSNQQWTVTGISARDTSDNDSMKKSRLMIAVVAGERNKCGMKFLKRKLKKYIHRQQTVFISFPKHSTLVNEQHFTFTFKYGGRQNYSSISILSWLETQETTQLLLFEFCIRGDLQLWNWPAVL